MIIFKTAKGNRVTFVVGACETQNVNVFVLPYFGLAEGSYVTAKDMWAQMVKEGQFNRENFNSFSVSWSSRKVKFKKGSSYNRIYTKFYGTSERAAQKLVHDSLTSYKNWEEEIEKWQNPILKDERLPEWYKFTLFNEL
ncbi:unnamed protein product [Linum trigynum]|uniref:Glycosyl-hydrolase family 116 N-terminal domain-containing protein n=1 Tax=Linum trigynum TaxID=586398 RepID=A0AAV2CE65_9ROSI